MSQPEQNQGVLLDAGTNELEILVFASGATRYGVNVAKVREVIGQVKLVSVPMTHVAVVGVFRLRESVIPLVDLQLYFDPANPSEAGQRNVILMEFNDRLIGFLVDKVDRIYRMGWGDVRPMPTTEEQVNPVVTSVCQIDGSLVLMVDFEKIAFDISGDSDVFREVQTTTIAAGTERENRNVLLAEDSATIRKAIESNLRQSGYNQITAVGDGAEAWSVLEASVAGETPTPFTVLVTDIEMPRMDGLHLCKRVKEHRNLKHLPVVVFSSLVSDTNLKKCEAVGANAALTKPQMVKLVDLLDELLSADRSTAPGGKAEPVLALS